MADLTEASTFHEGIYQIEQTDPVVGGAPDLLAGEGITNVPTKQLADRTRWLKNELASKTAPAALLAAVKTVDGTASGLDADLLDGKHASAFAERSANLSDLGSAATARSNLGLGSMATQNEGTAGTSFRDNAANDAHFVRKAGDSMSGAINMGGNSITNVSRVEWGGGDYLQWETMQGLIGHENGSQSWRIGSGGTTSISSIGSNTTSNSANTHTNSGGGMFRSTSSGVYKTDLEPVDGDVVLALRPVAFTSKHLADWDGRYAGFIAEEVEAAFPEASADDGENYDVRAIVAALVAKVQSQHVEILSLTDRLAALEAAQ